MKLRIAGAWRRVALAGTLAGTMLLAACGGSAPAPSGGSAGSEPTSELAYDPNATVTLVTNADPTFNPWHPNATS